MKCPRHLAAGSVLTPLTFTSVDCFLPPVLSDSGRESRAVHAAGRASSGGVSNPPPGVPLLEVLGDVSLPALCLLTQPVVRQYGLAAPCLILYLQGRTDYGLRLGKAGGVHIAFGIGIPTVVCVWSFSNEVKKWVQGHHGGPEPS